NTVMGNVPTVKKSKKGTAALRRFGLKKDVVRSVPLKRTTAPGTKLAPFTKTVSVPLERLPCTTPAGDNWLSVATGLAEGAASTLRMRLLSVSAIYKLPAASAITNCG